MSNEEKWYLCEDQGRGRQATVKLLQHPANRYWHPEVLLRTPLPSSLQASQVLVAGPGSVWMYAHVGAWAGKLGKQLEVEVIHPGGSGSVQNCRWQLSPPQGDRAFLAINMSRFSPLAPSAVDELIETIAQQIQRRRPRILVIGGQASVKVYAKLTHAAVVAGAERIACWSARDGLIPVFPLEKSGKRIYRPQWLTQLVQPKHSTIWGIVGDPHRGKSIFSEVLLQCLEKKGISAWKLDCDGASPTPPWFTISSDNPQIKEQREDLKLPWTPSMESTIAEHLLQGRELFEILIADLPGGNHKVTPPQRIPPSRKSMFRQIDKFILLTDTNDPQGQAWHRALEAFQLHRRLVAILVSTDPQAEPSFRIVQTQPVLQGWVTGLDRSRSASDIADAMCTQIEHLLKKLMN